MKIQGKLLNEFWKAGSKLHTFIKISYLSIIPSRVKEFHKKAIQKSPGNPEKKVKNIEASTENNQFGSVAPPIPSASKLRRNGDKS